MAVGGPLTDEDEDCLVAVVVLGRFLSIGLTSCLAPVASGEPDGLTLSLFEALGDFGRPRNAGAPMERDSITEVLDVTLDDDELR